MKRRHLQTGVNFIFAALAAAFCSQIAVALSDARFDERVNQIAPVFGIAVATVLIGGYRYLPVVFIGAVLPKAFAESNLLVVLSEPIAAVAAAAIARSVLCALKADVFMERIRDAFLVLILGAVVSTFFGALLQTSFLCGADVGFGWSGFGNLAFSHWLSAAVGTIIAAPFVQTWSNPASFRLTSKQLPEVLLWFVTLICFGHITFQNWAPTDTLLYPMELAIFPIMSWSAIRFGLRGASAGVLALALLAAWELIAVGSSKTNEMSQSPANVWIFVGIVSVTSVCLAAVMTELRAREARIAENESRLRAFTDALPDIAFVLREDGFICDVFAATSRICANHRIFKAESVRGKNITDIFDDSVCAGFRETISRALQYDNVNTYEYSLQSVDVGEHWFEARVTSMPRTGVEAQRVVWVAYDISSRKAYEKAIQDRDRILKGTALANNSLLTKIGFERAVDAALFEMGKALGVDRAYIFEVTGSERDDLHILEIHHEWSRKDAFPRLDDNTSLGNAPFEELCPDWYEKLTEAGLVYLESDSRDASSRAVLDLFQCQAILAIPIWTEGSLYGFLGVDYCQQEHSWSETEINAVSVLASGLSGLIVIHDHEQDLRGARDSADAASVAKGEFLAMMSHEIRTPMNAIIGYTDLLFQSELSEAQKEHASIIKRSGRALLDLINNILDYSKIESRSLELESERFDLEQIVCEALEGILPQAKEKGLSVDYTIEPSVKECYVGDAHRLRQVLMNLSNNAIKFTSKGSIRIHVKLAAGEQLGAGRERLRFEVADTGCGIPKEKFGRLFKAFSQVDSSTTRNFGGTGLGLIISKRLIERMEGEIWVESEVGVGSTFNFKVNLGNSWEDSEQDGADAKDTDLEILEPDFADDFPLRLLFCEDDMDNRWVIRELLETLGYRPDVVENAEEAVARLQDRDYDAVLLDVRLPGRNGIELTKAIRSGKEKVVNPEQYIIASTAFAMNEDRTKCLAAGMNDYIRKPIEILDLKEALKRAHAHSRA
jgi:PAS domain S-box-containing protein